SRSGYAAVRAPAVGAPPRSRARDTRSIGRPSLMLVAVAPRSALIGGVLCIVLLLIALVGPLLAPDPLAVDIEDGLTELGAPKGPSMDAPLGTDPLGRDVWARIAAGA